MQTPNKTNHDRAVDHLELAIATYKRLKRHNASQRALWLADYRINRASRVELRTYYNGATPWRSTFRKGGF